MVTATGESVPQLLEVADMLRQVRRTSRQFLLLWRIDQFARVCNAPQSKDAPAGRRDFRDLYTGSVLDD